MKIFQSAFSYRTRNYCQSECPLNRIMGDQIGKKYFCTSLVFSGRVQGWRGSCGWYLALTPLADDSNKQKFTYLSTNSVQLYARNTKDQTCFHLLRKLDIINCVK